jgi:hypothetical protein
VSYEFVPYRVVYTHAKTGHVVFDDVIQAQEVVDPDMGPVLRHTHLQILEDLHELFPTDLTVSWSRWAEPEAPGA